MMSEEVGNRSDCFEFCSANRIEEKGTCCGLIFTNTVETGETKISCGLFFSELVDKPVEAFTGGFYYYTAIKLGDGLRAKVEDINALLQDTKDDWLQGGATKAAMTAASLLIILA